MIISDGDHLTNDQIERYSRQLIMKDIGSRGVQKLLQSTVTVIGAGGLGCPAIEILAGAGVRHIKVIDDDVVSLSNLPRQTLHHTADVGRPKVDSVHDKIKAANPDTMIEPIKARLTRDNISELLKSTQYVIEATDNLATKFLVNDACIFFNIPFTIANVLQFGGQILSVSPGKSTCYRCMFDTPLDGSENFSAASQGIFATASIIGGSIEANEAIKTLLDLPNRLINRMLTFDLHKYGFMVVNLKPNIACPVCNDPKSPYYITAKYMNNKTKD